MRKVLIVIYSLFSIIAFLALSGITGFLFYTLYTENTADFNRHFTYIRNDIRTWYQEVKGFDSRIIRTRIEQILRSEERLFLLSIYSPGKGLVYAMEKRPVNSGSYVKSNLIGDLSEKDLDWEGRPEYRNLPLLRASLTKKLLDEPMLYIEALFFPFLKNEVSKIIKWGFLSLILWLMVTIIVRLFAVPKTGKTKVYRGMMTGQEEYSPSFHAYSEKSENQPVLKEIGREGDKGSFHAAEKKGTLELFSPRTGLGWGDHLPQRLGFEINRTAASNQDMVLAFITIDKFEEFTNPEEVYEKIARIILDTFPFQDLAFEYGKGSYALILPDSDLFEGIKNLEIFQKKISGKVFKNQAISVSIGISSRNGRLLSPDTIIQEARRAMEKASSEGRSRIIAFKADPEKYRKTLSEK
ncbi:MAG: diguanylate cyclase [Spirochaetales bacterium]|nr:diguanylate cyclase [Spirochaetales bacterium]